MHSIAERFKQYRDQINNCTDLCVEGKLVRMVGLTLEGVGCSAPIGAKFLIQSHQGKSIVAEVVGFSGDKLYLMTTDNTVGLSPGATITPLGKVAEVAVGQDLLGRVIDGNGKPLDGKGQYTIDKFYSLYGEHTNPLERAAITTALDVGVRSINALATIGRGQRMGLFSPTGVGKSVLLGMMTRFTKADVVVVGLIGERGREVKEFIENTLGVETMQRAVVVAAPADTSPLVRLHGAMRATAIAEYFRDQGASVLLLMDSLTRYAQAQRELALAIGEPPVTKGYPPSVFAKLSRLIERAGNARDTEGSITAFYTVLMESDDLHDPIAQATKSYLDGHLMMSHSLADSGIYPAVDVEKSISRVMHNIVTEDQLDYARRFKNLYALYLESRDLINVGAYQPGSDQQLDVAIAMMPDFKSFLMQSMQQPCSIAESFEQLTELFHPRSNE